MRLIYLPEVWTLALCFVVWPILQVAAALLCLFLPDRLFDPQNALFRTRRWEKDGHLYERLFHIRRWKHLLPDGAAAWKNRGYQKKHLDNFSRQNLNRYLTESARGEMTHWLAILPFWIFGFFVPPPVILLMLAYALLVNGPCIIAQRYNRPRILRTLRKLDSAAERHLLAGK
jgi:glycosyl-4,4'-diaponeurosporenoate acyltransferase